MNLFRDGKSELIDFRRMKASVISIGKGNLSVEKLKAFQPEIAHHRKVN
jgi:hypothetical protein